MERIFCNKKLKKVIVSILIVMILMPLTLPIKVWAVTEDEKKKPLSGTGEYGPYNVSEIVEIACYYGEQGWNDSSVDNCLPTKDAYVIADIRSLYGEKLGIDGEEAKNLFDKHKSEKAIYIKGENTTKNNIGMAKVTVSKICWNISEDEAEALGITSGQLDKAEKLPEPEEEKPAQYYMDEDVFYSFVEVWPDDERQISAGLNKEDYKLTNEDLSLLKTIYGPPANPDINQSWMYIENAIIEQGWSTYNSVLEEEWDNEENGGVLGKVVQKAAQAAAGKIDETYDESTVTPDEVVDGIVGNEDEGPDLGGILLSPLFALVNFVADAIIDNLGKIMDGQGLSTGLKILSSDKVDPEPDKTYYEYEVDMYDLNFVGTVQYPTITYTPERIFAGGVDLLSIDFISGKTPEKDENGNFIRDEDGNIKYTTNSNSDWMSIRTVISQWYKVLRMIAIIGLLSVLIYTGIKIIISANAKDKAKYKEWIINWFIAVAILFSMHYIMSFIISVTGEVNKLLNGVCQEILIVNGSTKSATNLMGLVRFMIQAEDFHLKVGFEIMYIALIVYTCKFTFVYLKRVLNMAFLTLIAPIVALTYPIDKINDGNAQGFNMWLKEYIYNALLQPMHYIMYYILVGSAISIAASNPLYGIVVLAFMAEAEKLLKKIFGFDKAGGGTVGGMAGAFAAGAIASNIKNIAKMAGGSGGKDGGLPGGEKDKPYEGLKPVNNDREKDLTAFNDPAPTTRTDSHEDEPDELEADGPGVDGPGADGPGADGPGADGPGADGPGADGPGADTPGADGPGVDGPGVDGPGADGPGIDGPGADGPGADEPGADEPGADGPGIDGDEPSRTPIRDMAKKIAETRHGRAMMAVGKKIMKPYWDFDQKGEEGKKYNQRRLMRKIGKGAVKGALGVGLGITAAAVQAGISITDGKYNPAEGIATFAAGYAGGGQIVKGFDRLADTYREGYDGDDDKLKMERAKKRWADDEKIREYNAKKYGGTKYTDADRENIIGVQQKLLEQGITDKDKMDQCIKYMKSQNKDSWYNDDSLIQKARVLSNLEDDLSSYGLRKAPTDEKERKNYIKAKARNDAEEAQYKNMLNELVTFRNANSKMK